KTSIFSHPVYLFLREFSLQDFRGGSKGFQAATDDAVECCADLNIPFFVDVRNKKLVFWFVRVDDEGYPEIARCTEREFATILAGISAGGMYCPECGTVHWPDGVPPPF
ncbi:hypothetical protein, partial [Escherichia coli]|uniref:hypothetical protein n=2 Tax=Escherichia coli TaxID=562 RepID=UPI001BC846ED